MALVLGVLAGSAPRGAEAQARPRAGEVVYGRVADLAADAAGLDRVLVRALIHVESRWRPGAVSVDDARGLMQILPSTAADYDPGADLFDPISNILIGVTHLQGLVRRHGVVRALAAWNAGEGALQRSPVFTRYRETRRFVAAVLLEMERRRR
ncbi:MAG: lytic transglycosylase domain-containing protein [Acidobacteria bacterium]|nr:lytic transglycosylase domain-containing protein [Acidobacteriota bacterium]